MRLAYEKYKSSGIPWVGRIPVEWDIRPFFAVAEVNKTKNIGNNESNLLSLSYGKIVRKDINTTFGLLPESFETYQVVESGNIVFRLTDLQNDKVSLRSALVKETGIITSAYLAVEFLKLDPRYANFLMRAYDKSMVFYELGGGVRQSAKYNDLKWMPILIPPQNEQKEIADFLEEKTKAIDKLIVKKQKLLSLLSEKRSALITKAVTKGLDDTPMKSSGYDWIGQIPNNWKIVPLMKHLEAKIDYRGKTPEKVGEGVFLITAKNVKMGRIDYESSKEYVPVDQYEKIMRRGYPKIGDLLFTTEAPLGNVAMIDKTNVALAQRIILFRPCPKSFVSKFLLYALMEGFFQNDLKSYATGSTALGIKSSKHCYLKVLCPPLKDQCLIVEFLDKELALLDRASQSLANIIQELKIHRSTLIASAVTGKIKVV